MSISETIRERREALGLSKRRLAVYLDITHPSVVQWENGRTVPCRKHRVALAKLFGISAEALHDAIESPAT
jgi:transcriptional regulator with XRE-family HTH domain